MRIEQTLKKKKSIKLWKLLTIGSGNLASTYAENRTAVSNSRIGAKFAILASVSYLPDCEWVVGFDAINRVPQMTRERWVMA